MKILIAGDFCDRYRVSDKIKEGLYSFLFDEVKPIIEEADYSFVNFVLTPSNTQVSMPVPWQTIIFLIRERNAVLIQKDC